MRVCTAAAGVEVQRLLQHVANDVRGTSRRCYAQGLDDDGRTKHRIETGIPVPTADVVQQVPHGHLCPAHVSRGCEAKQFPDLRVQREFPALGKLQDSYRRDRLGNARNAEQGVRLDSFVPRTVRKAESARVDQAAVAGHRECSAGGFLLSDEPGQQGVEAGQFRRCGAGHRWHRWLRTQRPEACRNCGDRGKRLEKEIATTPCRIASPVHHLYSF